jgi:hypothetical protein
MQASSSDALLLSTLDLARVLADAGGHNPLFGIEADRRGFAPHRRRLLPMITTMADGQRPAPGQRSTPEDCLRASRATATRAYLAALDTPQEAVHVGPLLLRHHTRRLTGEAACAGLLGLAAAAELAALAWHRATRSAA